MTAFKMLDIMSAPLIGALLTSLWQSSAITLMVMVTLRCTKRLNASTRYAVWWGTLAATIALTVLSVGSVSTYKEQTTGQSLSPVVQSRASNHAVISRNASVPNQRETPVISIPATAQARISPSILRWVPLEIHVRWLPGILACIWILATLVMLARIYHGVAELVRLKIRALPLAESYRLRMASLIRLSRLGRSVLVGTSKDLRTPVAAGLYRPIVLIPEALLPQLTDAEFDQIVLHELAHLQRWDDWANLLQRFIEAVFVFHPAVRFICNQINLEREIACDDRVLSQTRRARDYAACLTRLVEMTGWARQSVPAPGATLRKSQLAERVEKLLDRTRNVDPQLTKRVVVLVSSALLVAVLLSARMPALWAFNTASDDSPVVKSHLRAVGSVIRPEHLPNLAPRQIALPLSSEPDAPQLLAAASPGDDGGQTSTSYSTLRDGPHTHMRWTQNSRTFEVEQRGEIEFTDDDSDVKLLAPGGIFRMDEQGSPERAYEVKADGSGNLSRTYQENGRSVTINEEGRNWLAVRLPEVVRETGAGAAKRVQRILRQRGVDGGFSEVRLIRSDGSKRIYLEELILHGSLNEAQLRTGMSLARSVSSDGEKRLLLTSVAPLYLTDNLRRDLFDTIATISSDGEHARVLSSVVGLDPANGETLLLAARSARQISSDGEKARVLILLADRYRSNESMRSAWFASLDSIASDGEKRRALSAVISRDGGDRDTLVEAMKSAAGISSDGERAALLIESSDYYVEDPAIRRNFFAAVDGISSDGEKHKVLTVLFQKANRNDVTVKQVLRSSLRISSDGEKAALLRDVAGANGLDGEVLDDFFQACDSISSDGEHASVLLRVVEHSNGDTPVMLRALESTVRISSDGEKARVLAQVIKFNPRDKALRSALRKSIEAVHSDGEHRQLSIALASQELI